MNACQCGHDETAHHMTNNWIEGRTRTHCLSPFCDCKKFIPGGKMIVPITAKQAREVHDVQVRIGKLTLTALVSGSLNDFATVSFYVSPEGSGGAKVLVSFQYSWDAIAHSTNTGKPLLP